MEPWTWGALIALGAFIITVGGKVWALSGRLTKVESTSDNAAINVAANTMRCETMARLLSEHKESVAINYVSNRALENLENRLVDAIGRLGDRLDKLFTGRTSPA